MNTQERNKLKNERLLSVMKENILLARDHERKGKIDCYLEVMAFVRGMMYACGILKPQYRWTKKINDFYEVLNNDEAT